ncbi:hypothetical protein GUJ93_ZPchr0012g19997 [Zizania palustris]|uniref:Uncharacterized protein n=1 Tax=Zizania palustris TaxID=103762 RepID=A0A8J5WPF9_ZIZPA|nr:hypothetical protein GUJ93_ZPchr0012g19997 [Zizania palustris]
MEGLEVLDDDIRWQLVLSLLGDEVDGVLSEFHGSFGDPPNVVPISQDVAEWELDDHLHEVGLEVVFELSDGDEDNVQQLLHLAISNLRHDKTSDMK